MSFLPPPLPGIGYATYYREMAIDKLGLTIDLEEQNFTTNLGKTVLNSAIRCTSYAVPYISYLSWPYSMYLSKYVNMGLSLYELGQSLYSSHLAKNTMSAAAHGALQLKAREAFKKALWYGAFAAIDVASTRLFGAEVVVLMVSAYVGLGFLSDVSGWSSKIHGYLFSTRDRSGSAASEARMPSSFGSDRRRVRDGERPLAEEEEEEPRVWDAAPSYNDPLGGDDWSDDDLVLPLGSALEAEEREVDSSDESSDESSSSSDINSDSDSYLSESESSSESESLAASEEEEKQEVVASRARRRRSSLLPVPRLGFSPPISSFSHTQPDSRIPVTRVLRNQTAARAASRSSSRSSTRSRRRK